MFNVLNAATWGDMAKEKKRASLNLNLLLGWLGLGKLQLFLFLLFYV